jgi:CheY-like chemotaxis protein
MPVQTAIPVLLVDDEPTGLRSLARILRREGYAPECLTSGEAALERLTAGVSARTASDGPAGAGGAGGANGATGPNGANEPTGSSGTGRRFEFVILDLQMPGIGGLGVLAGLQAIPESHRPMVIVCSGAGDEILGQARRLGADRVLRKPFDLETLLGMLRSLGQARAAESRNPQNRTAEPASASASAGDRSPSLPPGPDRSAERAPLRPAAAMARYSAGRN